MKKRYKKKSTKKNKKGVDKITNTWYNRIIEREVQGMSKQDIKRIIKDCMNCELGFSPVINAIVLLECGYGEDGKPYYIRFRTTRNENIEYVMKRNGGANSGYYLFAEGEYEYELLLNK